MDRDAPTGTRIRDERAMASRYPLDRPYARFTAEEKARLRAEYADMPEEDEPPFPLNGFRPIIEELSRVITARRISGDFWIYVTVDPKGEAVNFDLIKYPDIESAKVVAYVLGKATYKPAVCGGQPCTMQLAFRASLRR